MDSRLRLAKRLALAAGSLVRDRYFSRLEKFSIKGDRSPVTVADLASNKLIISKIQKTFPKDSIISEETTQPKGTSEYCWYIDPIDGTTNFIMGLDIWAVSIGLTFKGKPFAGAIYLPVQRQLFVAQAGKGATLNGKRLHVKGRRVAQVASIVRSRSKRARAAAINAYKVMLETPMTVRVLGSSVFELALVAQGKTDFAVFIEQNSWDVAAGIVIAKEAGAPLLTVKHTLGVFPQYFIIGSTNANIARARKILRV